VEPVRVLIVDDDATFASALVSMLELDPRVEVVGEAADGAEAVAEVERLRPDAVTMDLDMPVLDGIAATGLILRRHPSVAVVVLTGSTSGDGVRRALDQGAATHVPKRDSWELLVPALLGATAPQALRGSARL
jgi:DNA-binding NarL/FixJ family response regulator